MPVTRDESQRRRGQRNDRKSETVKRKPDADTDSLKVLSEAKELMQTLVSLIAELKKPSVSTIDRQQKVQPAATGGITCYFCRQKGHISRDCPERVQTQRKSQGNGNLPEQGRRQKTTGNHLN